MRIGCKMQTKPPSLEARALKFLSRREYPRAELLAKLKPFATNDAELDNLLDRLQSKGFISDYRYVEAWLHARGKRFGSRRIKQELQRKGVCNEVIEHSLERSDQEELKLAQSVLKKKFDHPSQDIKERAKRARFLLSRGFSHEVIRKVIAGNDDECA